MKRLVDFSSRFRILKGGKISLVVSAIIGSTTLSFAAPSGGVVTSGNANISQNGNITNIVQDSQKASINWKDFSINQDEIVNFKQPNVNSITLNRVIGNEKSIINGALNANGQVWILNSNGVLFGKNAKINTAGLLATTKNLSDEDFNTGNYNFKGSSTQSVINLGEIDISDSGYATLLANSVSNGGTIKAVKGSVRLIGANEVSINLNGNSIVDLTVDKGVLDSLVENKGAVYADGGEIFLTTNAVDELLKGVVNNTGIIEANSLDGITGHVELFAHGGEAKISGSITAHEGFVETSGKEFTFNDAKIEAGEWLIDPVNVTIDENLAGAIETQLNNNGDVVIETETPYYSDVDTSNNESGTEGNIYVNSDITWTSGHKLTLSAYNDIFINAVIDGSAGNGKLALHYGDSGDYYINSQVNLSAGDNFFTKQTSDTEETTWTVITDLGSAGSTTGTDLQGINGNLSGNYVLGTDIDASATSSWNSGEGFKPIGTFFQGNFDGLGHTIDSLFIDRPSKNYVGLFKIIQDSIISNVGLTNADITSSSYSGGLVGQMQSSAMVKNSYVTGSVSGGNNVYIGGLVGQLQSGTVKNSYSIANVDGASYIGGLVGQNQSDGTILNSYSSGSVTVGPGKPGGLVASNSGTVTNSWYDNEANTNTSMSDKDTYGKTKAEILTALSSLDAWTAGGGANVEGYSTATPLALPQLITFYTSSGEILFAGGFGTEADPYEITNWTQLQNINNSNILTQDYYFKLLNDLDSSTSDYTTQASASANSNKGWNPIGLATNFKGVFDGMNHTIDSLTMNNTFTNYNYVGLFGMIRGESVIKNIHLTNLDITTGNYVGGLVGYVNSEDAIIENASVSGKIVENGTSNQSAAGLAGINKGTILNSHSKVELTGTYNVGGLVGLNRGLGLIKNSYSDSIVNGGDNSTAGGLVGWNYQGTIENSYALGKVMGTSLYLGGLVGANSDTIKNSYFDGIIEVNNESSTTNANIGAVTGLNGGTIENSYASGKIDAIIDANGNDVNIAGVAGKNGGTIKNSYSNVEIKATVSHAQDVNIAGVAGDNSDTIENSYASGKIAVNDNSNTNLKVGGVAGINDDVINNSYYDKTVNSGMADEDLYGKTTAQLQDINTFKDGSENEWSIVEDSTLEKGTPILAWQVDKDGEKKPVWLIASKVTTEPEKPTPEREQETQKEIDKVVTTIVNKEAVKVNIPKVDTKTPLNSGKNVNISFKLGENKAIVSKPIEGQGTKRVTLSQAKQMQQEATGETVGEVKVPLSRSSIIELVDGGVSLPTGVEQEFYVADEI